MMLRIDSIAAKTQSGKILGFVFFLVAFLVGCSNESTHGIKTSGIDVTVYFDASAAGVVETEAYLEKAGGSDTLELADGESLSVTVNGVTKILDKNVVLDSFMWSPVPFVSYKGRFENVPQEADITITYDRPNKAGAATTFKMPPFVSVSSPQPGQSYSRTLDDLTISWISNPDYENIHAGFNGCGVENFPPVSGGADSVTIPAGTIVGIQGDCDASVRVIAWDYPVLDSSFSGGSRINVAIFNDVPITSVP